MKFGFLVILTALSTPLKAMTVSPQQIDSCVRSIRTLSVARLNLNPTSGSYLSAHMTTTALVAGGLSVAAAEGAVAIRNQDKFFLRHVEVYKKLDEFRLEEQKLRNDHQVKSIKAFSNHPVNVELAKQGGSTHQAFRIKEKDLNALTKMSSDMDREFQKSQSELRARVDAFSQDKAHRKIVNSLSAKGLNPTAKNFSSGDRLKQNKKLGAMNDESKANKRASIYGKGFLGAIAGGLAPFISSLFIGKACGQKLSFAETLTAGDYIRPNFMEGCALSTDKAYEMAFANQEELEAVCKAAPTMPILLHQVVNNQLNNRENLPKIRQVKNFRCEPQGSQAALEVAMESGRTHRILFNLQEGRDREFNGLIHPSPEHQFYGKKMGEPLEYTSYFRGREDRTPSHFFIKADGLMTDSSLKVLSHKLLIGRYAAYKGESHDYPTQNTQVAVGEGAALANSLYDLVKASCQFAAAHEATPELPPSDGVDTQI